MTDECRRCRSGDRAIRAEGRYTVSFEIDTAAQATGKDLDGFPAQFGSVVVQDLLVGQNRVEDAHDPGLEPVCAVVSHGERFGAALGLVVAAARPDRVD